MVGKSDHLLELVLPGISEIAYLGTSETSDIIKLVFRKLTGAFNEYTGTTE